MDYFTIVAQRNSLHTVCAGRKVEIVRLFGKHTVYIGFDGGPALKLCGTPGMPYIHTVEKQYIPVRNAHDWHQSKFSGMALDEIAVTPGDRILTFRFSSGFRLVFELTGRYANIIVVNPDGFIEGSVRVITRRQSGFREIRPGIAYMPPPVRGSYDLVWGALPVLESRLKGHEGPLDEALAVTLCAGSRLFAREVLTRCGLDPTLTPADLSHDDTLGLFKAIAALADHIENGGDGATVIRSGDGIPADVFPLPMQTAGNNSDYYSDLDEAVSLYSREREHLLELNQLRHTIASGLRREEKRLRTIISKIEREREHSSEAETLDRTAAILLANTHRVRRGLESVTLPDLYGSGEIDIELDPTLDGPANAERLFARARKLRASFRHSDKRIEDLRCQVEKLQAEYSRFESIDDLRELRKLAATFVSMSAPDRNRDTDRLFPRRLMSQSGLEIIVGRNDRENDALVRWAGKNDIWLHAQGVGGSHVVLRSPGKQNPDHQSLELAAAVAAYYSKAKTSSVVPVVWTHVKYVVKHKGQGPGQVRYSREKVLFVEPALPKSGGV